MKPFIIETGYTESDLYWIPISGLSGENILHPVEQSVCNWYGGPPLVEILDNLPVKIEDRNPDGALRIPVLDKMKEANRMIIFGKWKVESEKWEVKSADYFDDNPEK